MDKYYIAIDSEDIIWGVGESEGEALKNGKNEVAYFRKCGVIKKLPKLKVLRATKEVFDDIKNNGYCHWDFGNNSDGIPYWEYNPRTKIAFYPKAKTRKSVFAQIESLV